MSTTTHKVNIGLTFADSSTRQVSFTNVKEQELLNISSRVQAINNNMSNAFKQTFVNDDGSHVVAIGKAQLVTTVEDVIYSAN